MAIELFVLGHPRVEVDGRDLPSFQRQKLRLALLTFTAVEREASREQLVGVFWPDRPQDAARHALSQTLYEIRQELPDDPFIVDGDRIRTSDRVGVDAAALEAALAADDAATACTLYRGPFLEGAYLWRTREWEAWVDMQRARMVRLHRKARRLLLAARDAEGRLADALVTAREWVALDVDEDEAHHHLIDLLARNGRRTAALEHYESYARRLREEQDVEPLDETRVLVERIRSGGGSTEAAASRAFPIPAGASDAAAEPNDDLGPGVELIRLIGEGSVARVYLARETALRRLVALKILDPEVASDRTTRMRFAREAESAARILHPNVVPVHSIGESTTGRPFITMPYVKGGSLAERLAAWGPLEIAEAREFVCQVAAGLAAAHRLGIIHRDVRAANVLFDQDSNRCMLCDFGLAAVLEEISQSSIRLTRTGEWIGNPSCMSPEQLLGQPVGPKTDVYGLGGLAFELLAGRGPFDATTPAQVTLAHVRTPPRRITEFRDDVPDALVDLIDRCLAKRPEHRPGVNEILSELA